MRSAGQEARLEVPSGHTALADGAEAVHVLVGGHAVSHHVGVHLTGGVQRHLDDDTVHIAVLIQLLDPGQQLGLRGGPRQGETGGLDTNQLCSLQLHPDVDIAVLAAPHLITT